MSSAPEPAQQLRRLVTITTPVLLLAVVAVFMLERPEPVTGPPPEAIAATVADPCALFTSREMGVLVDARIVARNYQPMPPRHVCGYHGDADSAGTVVEVGVVSARDLRAQRGRGFGPDALLAETLQSAGGQRVDGLGDEAHYLALGAGELWVRDGDLVATVAVIRDVTRGDRDAATNVARAVLAKVAAAAD